MKNTSQTLLLGAGFGAAFLIGQCFPRSVDANLDRQTNLGSQTLDAQGRGPINSPPPSAPITPSEAGGGTGNAPTLSYVEESSTASSSNGFLAVTGSYGMGTSVLYLIDTENRQLAVYEARGGSTSQHRIVMIGARRIDLDLQLHGYNDRSEYEYSDLEKLFEKRDSKDRSVNTGLDPKGRSNK